MKLTYKEKEYELKYTFRAMMLYENITGAAFNPKTMSDMIVFFYCILLAQSKNDPIDFDEFLSYLDDNQDIFDQFTQWLVEVYGSNEKKKPAVEENKDNNESKN